jgi:hypothetical protein
VPEPRLTDEMEGAVKRLLFWLTLQLEGAMLNVASGKWQADLELEEEGMC